MAASSQEPLCLHVLVLSANNLYKKGTFGFTHPYVKATIVRTNERKKPKPVQSQVTKSQKHTRNPEWNQKLILKDVSLEKDVAVFEIFDNNKLGSDDFLGRVIIKLSSFPIERRKVDIFEHGRPHTFELKGRSSRSRVSGNLRLKLLFYNSEGPSVPATRRRPLPPQPTTGQTNIGSLVPGANGEIDIGQPLNSPVTPTTATPTNGSGETALQRQVTISDDWAMIDTEEEQEEPLPRGWEQRQDANGRMFYVDHVNRRTQWERPQSERSSVEGRQRMEVERQRRFQQTMRRRIPTAESSPSLNTSITSTSGTASPTPTPRATPRQQPVTRPVSAITPTQSNEDDLPPGWEMRLAANGRKFYINHNTRTTQWEPPPRGVARSQSVSPTPTPTTPTPPVPPRGVRHQQSLPQQPSQQQLSRQPSPQQPLPQQPLPQQPSPQPPSEEELGPLKPGWEMRILADGRKFFIDHNTRSTQWEDPRLNKSAGKSSNKPTYDRDYKRKYDNFQRTLAAKKPENLPRQFDIPVRRDHLFEDSHRAIMGVKRKELLLCRLYIKFHGESGLDYGGLAREWFFLLSHEMLNPYYGLFEYAASDNYTLQINPDSGQLNENHLDFFRFIGRVFAMAIYHRKLIDAFFVRPFYKLILGKPVTLHDMEAVDSEFYNSAVYILENDPEPLCLTFTASREFLGQVEEINLKPNGSEIDVTEENKKEYIKLLIKWRCEERISKQVEAVKKGFSDVFPLNALKVFDERELEYLMCGLGEINVEDWKKNTIYQNGYQPQDPIIMWFWKAVENMDNEMRARLLQFVTGTSKVPMNGFAELHGSNGPQRFCIKKLGAEGALPRSHTCFNRIDLPPYRSYHELKEKLKLAIENTEGFEGVD